MASRAEPRSSWPENAELLALESPEPLIRGILYGVVFSIPCWAAIIALVSRLV
jgi:hypothetical protein